jgi:hypothetical protein
MAKRIAKESIDKLSLLRQPPYKFRPSSGRHAVEIPENCIFVEN